MTRDGTYIYLEKDSPVKQILRLFYTVLYVGISFRMSKHRSITFGSGKENKIFHVERLVQEIGFKKQIIFSEGKHALIFLDHFKHLLVQIIFGRSLNFYLNLLI